MKMLSCENRGASLIAGRGPATKMPALAGARASRSHVLRGGEWLKVHGPAGWRNPYFPGGITPMEGAPTPHEPPAPQLQPEIRHQPT
jgi:uncharacterized protein with beta-barrel porin domain